MAKLDREYLPEQKIEILVKEGGEWSEDVKKKIGTITANIITYCSDLITPEFSQDALNDAEVLFISYDMRNGKPVGIRGFAAIEAHKIDEDGNFNYSEDEEKYESDSSKFKPFLYIDLICNSLSPGVDTRAKVKGEWEIPAGKHMLQEIQKYAVENEYKYVKLNAIVEVITYYYKYGWRFIPQCGVKESPRIAPAINNLYLLWRKIQKYNEPGKMKPSEEDAEELYKTIHIFMPYMKEFYSDKRIASSIFR